MNKPQVGDHVTSTHKHMLNPSGYYGVVHSIDRNIMHVRLPDQKITPIIRRHPEGVNSWFKWDKETEA